jgi:hypothetical protein
MGRMEKSVEKSEEMTAAIDGLIGGANGRVGVEIGGVIRRRSWFKRLRIWWRSRKI